MFCKECGKQLKDGAKFCNECGAAQNVQVNTSDNYQIFKESENHTIEYGRRSSNKIRNEIIGGLIAVAAVVVAIIGIYFWYYDKFAISHIKKSYLNGYLSETIKDAFEDGLYGVSWEYEYDYDLDMEFILCEGYFLSDSNEKVKVKIPFYIYDDDIEIYMIELEGVHGNEGGLFTQKQINEFCDYIYYGYDFSWNWY